MHDALEKDNWSIESSVRRQQHIRSLIDKGIGRNQLFQITKHEKSSIQSKQFRRSLQELFTKLS